MSRGPRVAFLGVKSVPRCPGCHRTIHFVSSQNTESPAPQPGDWSVCYGCLAVCRYTGVGLEQRLARPEEVQAAVDAGSLDPSDGDLLMQSFTAYLNRGRRPS